MLTKEEKLKLREDYLNSDKFGIVTYYFLFSFRNNTIGFLHAIKFLDVLISKIDDKNFFDHNLSNKDIVRTQQFIMLDIITRVISIIEGLLVLVHSLSDDYSTIRQNMIQYRTKLVWKIIGKIRKKDYNMEKVLAFPKIDTLPLEKDEKELLSELYSHSINTIFNMLEKLCTFYEQYNLIYRKTKHGMTLNVGGFKTGRPKSLENSSLSAFDHKEVDKIPKTYSIALQKTIPYRWFNVQSHLNFNEKFRDELSHVVYNLRELCNYITGNHFTLVNNCGQGYLPYRQQEKGKASSSFYYNGVLSSAKAKLLLSIQEKIFKNMVSFESELKINESYSTPNLMKQIEENSITNIWIQGEY